MKKPQYVIYFLDSIPDSNYITMARLIPVNKKSDDELSTFKKNDFYYFDIRFETREDYLEQKTIKGKYMLGGCNSWGKYGGSHYDFVLDCGSGVKLSDCYKNIEIISVYNIGDDSKILNIYNIHVENNKENK